jgi:hypothetical protein
MQWLNTEGRLYIVPEHDQMSLSTPVVVPVPAAARDGGMPGAADAAFADLASAAAAGAWQGLPGVKEALSLMELALAQNTYLPQLLMYR